MKTIQLTQGKEAIVDDCDYEYLNQFKWCVNGDSYAVRGGTSDEGKQFLIFMHHAIAERMGLKIDGLFVDHKDVDQPDSGLHNWRDNLRIATKSQNGANRPSPRNNTSGYKGVYWHKLARKWMTSIGVEQRYIYLGLFTDKIEAAKAYNAAAIKYFGEFAYLNAV